jgi:hypothetical protein
MAFKTVAGERQFNESEAKYRYYCLTCGEPCFSNHAELKATNPVTGKETSGYGLGSWRCRKCGHTKVERKKK